MTEPHALGLWLGHLRRTPLLLFLILYTVVTGGPFLWVASMSLRTTPETSLDGKRICVTGPISYYHGKPEIVLTDPSQLSQ